MGRLIEPKLTGSGLLATLAAMLGLFAVTAQMQAQGGQFQSPGGSASGAYHDPQGRYSLAVPPGWNTASDNGNLTLSSGPGWVTVATGTGAQPSDVNHQIVGQIQAQYKSFQLLNEGDFQTTGTRRTAPTQRASIPRVSEFPCWW